MRNFSGVIATSLLIITLTACAPSTGANEGVYTTVSEVSLAPGDAIPSPQGDVVLTVTGDIAGGSAQFDMAAIEALGLVEYTVEDPFIHEIVTYRGPLLSDLLAFLQADEGATNLHLVALNDYAVDMPIHMAYDYPIVFAIMADGEYMAIADRGPAMLVLPYGHFEFERPAADAFWIWQIARIEVQ
jgi:hypothetical protein